MPVWLTLLMSALLPVLPQLFKQLPANVAPIATAVLSLAGSLYHLFQPSPSAK